MKSLIISSIFTIVGFVSYGQNIAPAQQNVSEAELKQKIFSAGRGEAVHVDIVAPSEKKEDGTNQTSTSKGQSATFKSSTPQAAPVKSERKEKHISKTSKGISEDIK